MPVTPSVESGMTPAANSSGTLEERKTTLLFADAGEPPESPWPSGCETPDASVTETIGIGFLCGSIPNSMPTPPRKRPWPPLSRRSRR